MHAGRWPEAEAALRRVLQAQPSSAEALYLLGATLFHENKPKESLQTFTEAARFARPSALDFRFIALDYVLLNDYDDADTWISRAVHDDPADPESWYALGRVRYTQNRFADAISAFQQSLAHSPKSVKAENNLGLAFEGLNQPEQAMRCYREAIEWDKANPHRSEQPLLNLGILLTDRNQLDEALPLLQQAEALSPRDPKIHSSLGKLFARRNQLPQAQAELELAVNEDPENSALRFQLGQVYRRQGLTARATEELRKASELEARKRQ